MNGDLKLTFMQKVLSEYNQDVMDAMQSTMAFKKVGVTGEGERSLAYEVLMTGSSGSSKLTFKEYLRFVDMGVSRGHPLGGLKAMKVALTASNKEGLAFKKDNTIKPKKIYSKVAYGKLTHMYNRLLYGFTQETIDQLTKEMQQKNI